MKPYDRQIILEDGCVFKGYGFGSMNDKVCEIVFNTSMVGYQEILSDPSYTYQAVVMTYPWIGNYGICEEDYETLIPSISGLIVSSYEEHPSNFRTKESLGEMMRRFDIAGIEAVDTRELARHIRKVGSCKALIADSSLSLEEGLTKLKTSHLLVDAVSHVSTKEIYTKKSEHSLYHVVAFDCGMKQNIVRSLNKKGCDVTIVPWNTSMEVVESLYPDGIFISNGPGDPMEVTPLILTIRQLLGKYPMFGICLGHQIIGLAYGAKTYKLKFGHRGGNHPVKNLLTGKVEITSQNHSYAIHQESLNNTPLEITHINLLDGTVEGCANKKDKVFSVQYHPESAPGPQDSHYLFDQFIEAMKGGKCHD